MMPAYIVTVISGCPHGCGPLWGADDAYICQKCGDEWDIENVEERREVADEAAAREVVYDAVAGIPHRPGEASRVSESISIPGSTRRLAGGVVIVVEEAKLSEDS